MAAIFAVERIDKMHRPAHATIAKPVILHVEDGKVQSEVLRIILEGNGFSVLSAANAEEALDLF